MTDPEAEAVKVACNNNPFTLLTSTENWPLTPIEMFPQLRL